jgi:hypothetical protein
MLDVPGIRHIAPLRFPDLQPRSDIGAAPIFELVDPSTLMVDEKYQRNLSERSVTLIRRIITEWEWSAFKPPIVARVEGRLHVIDGQHTAIAATSHPLITSIPVMIVSAAGTAQRANAFVRHNRDRLQVTATQIHHAMVAAGDPDAVTIQQLCERAGARVLKLPPSQGKFKVGDTMAIVCLRSLVNRRHAKGARTVLQTCVEGKLAPVSAVFLRAVEELLFGTSYAGQLDAADIATTIRELGALGEKQAAQWAAEHDLPIWKGLVVTLFRNTKRARRGRS